MDMEKNKKLLTEAFFKKASYSDRLQRKLPQYNPMDGRGTNQPGFGSILSKDKYEVTDSKEAIKRLTGFFGAQMTTTTVKSLASKSVKTFPIIISENVEPETQVMLKRVMEEQYAEFMNLLISNQVVDLSAFRTGGIDDGNIAIQAVNALTGDNPETFARKAVKGSIGADELFSAIPVYNLIRNESEYKTGIELLDTLLEGAIIFPAESESEVIPYITKTLNEMSFINEVNSHDLGRHLSLDDLIASVKGDNFDSTKTSLVKKGELIDTIRGYDSASKSLTKFTGPSAVLLSKDKLMEALDKTVADIFLMPGNERLKDRFEKASFLLIANRISGSEYVSYLMDRLGIPVASGTRGELVSKYRTQDIRNLDNPGEVGTAGLITSEDLEDIRNNRAVRQLDRTIGTIVSATGKEILNAIIIGGGVGAATSAAVILGMAVAGTIVTPFILPALAATGVSAAIAGIIRSRKKSSNQQTISNKIEGWERVENLIIRMERQQDSVRSIDKQKSELDTSLAMTLANAPITGDELTKLLNDNTERLEKLFKGLKASYRESVAKTATNFILTEESSKYFEEITKKLLEEVEKDPEYIAEQLSEAVISTTVPIQSVIKYEMDPKAKPQVLATPAFSARSSYAYGSIEYDKRELKDRRYNAPLILTVKFKERFADGTFADNELVAAIGILGVITRVPSNEMEYILKSNTEGQTLRGIFKGDGGINDLANTLINAPRIKKDIEKLSQSLDVWRNLENVSMLAASNKLGGRKDNNIANAHIVFSQKEVDSVRVDTGIDYLKDKKLTAELMKRYSAFTIMVTNDTSERVYIFDDLDNISWNVVPYSAFRNKDTGDQLNSMLSKMASGRL
jgi:hypothetical protein